MTLRLRLTVAFLALALLLLGAGVASLAVSTRLGRQVADLGTSHGVDLRSLDLANVCLEFEGFWDPAGSFFATDVEVVLGSSRPRLRGEVQQVRRSERVVVVFGVPIEVGENVEFDEVDGVRRGLADLAVGDRIEVTCSIEAGVWLARKIRTVGVKSTDKIKGVATDSDLDGVAPETIDLHGLLISLAPSTDVAPESALAQLSLATQMALALEECRSAAQAIAASEAIGTDAIVRLSRAADDFAYSVDEAPHRGARERRGPSDVTARWIRPLTEQVPRLREHVARLTEYVDDRPHARAYVEHELEPFLQTQLLPRVYAYLSQTEEELGDQVRAIATRSDTTTRLVLWTSVVAVALAVALWFWVWRSIHGPIQSLHRAALALGGGRLETRVPVESRDELGDLAQAFNRMADELDRTTVSIAEKELLLREVHHRVKNNMQVISSLLAMQAGQAVDADTRARLQQSQDRIRSMALIHEQLYRSDDLAGVDSRAYIQMLTDHLRRSFGDVRSVGIELEVDDVDIDVDQSLSCGLIINELVTNAFKHAFEDSGVGAIEVSLKEDGDGRRILTVADDGRGVEDPESITRSGSLGMSLVTMLARQHGGEVSVAGLGGTSVRIVFPPRLSEAVA